MRLSWGSGGVRPPTETVMEICECRARASAAFVASAAFFDAAVFPVIADKDHDAAIRARPWFATKPAQRHTTERVVWGTTRRYHFARGGRRTECERTVRGATFVAGQCVDDRRRGTASTDKSLILPLMVNLGEPLF